MRKSNPGLTFVLFLIGTVLAVAMFVSGCGDRYSGTPVALSGVREVTPEVVTGSDGLTNEQRNIKNRLKIDNVIGAIKHLYVQSSMSGDVLLYSTVKGKVTSSGKRLSPTSVEEIYYSHVALGASYRKGQFFKLNGQDAYTREMLQDDGTYGDSITYLYWWDVNDRYHQHYPSGGQVIHITSEPMALKKVHLKFEKD